MSMTKMMRTLESLPSLPTKFTKSLPVDIYTANVTETNTNNLMRTPRHVLNAVYSHVIPESAPDPVLLGMSKKACEDLDLDYNDLVQHHKEESAQVFSGNRLLKGTRPWSLCYAGHQFGYFAGQLGDGRAVSLFESKNHKGEHWELQLKGAGRTPYSRFGDGYAVLRSSIREFLMSEYMNALGVPTTRALALIGTSREVYRDDGPMGGNYWIVRKKKKIRSLTVRIGQPERGAIVTRMAPSWLRFGNFELFYSRDDMENVRVLANYAIDNVVGQDKEDTVSKETDNKYARFFRYVTKMTAKTVAEWQAIGMVDIYIYIYADLFIKLSLVGFNHGVLNTDNMSILGLTMDYGPYQIMDYYDPGYICNHSDETGREYIWY